ncbi:TPA: hypothetical protein ACUL5G_000265 [Haemophilus influenzae]
MILRFDISHDFWRISAFRSEGAARGETHQKERKSNQNKQRRQGFQQPFKNKLEHNNSNQNGRKVRSKNTTIFNRT